MNRQAFFQPLLNRLAKIRFYPRISDENIQYFKFDEENIIS